MIRPFWAVSTDYLDRLLSTYFHLNYNRILIYSGRIRYTHFTQQHHINIFTGNNTDYLYER